jgi:hypothetical protein
MGLKARVLALLLVLGYLVPFGTPASGAEGPAMLGVVRRGGSTRTASTADTRARRANLIYHGGRILPRSTARPVFWEPPGYSFPAGYKALIERYFADVAADSQTADNVHSVLTQYYDRRSDGRIWHRVHYVVTAAPSITVTDAFPAGCPIRTGYTACVLDRQIRARVNSVKTSYGLNSVYLMFLPEHVDTCFGQYCASNYFCAYHSAFKVGGHWVIYTNQPFAAVSGCDYADAPNGNVADHTINVASHEHREAINDPLGNAWYDRNGYEGSDKCQFAFGTPLGSTPDGDYNQLINGNTYELQAEWSNRNNGCRLRR